MTQNNNHNTHPYHLVEPSPWPIATSAALFILAMGIIMYLHEYNFASLVLSSGICSLLFCLYSWWRDVINEGRVGKFHTSAVRKGLRIGMLLFILSEVMFFFAFFFAYFFSSMFPAGILDGIWVISEGSWPPSNIQTFDPWDIPFMNTLILLLSGTTVTWAHHAIKNHNRDESVKALGITIMLGLLFSAFQAYEYHHAAFGLKDGIYAANFYLATGFHGVHVLIGTIFLTICYFRARNNHFDKTHGHLGFEFAAWYWHFVDVVWLVLFVCIYL